MRTLMYITGFFLLVLSFGCGPNTSEKKLLGRWYEVEMDGKVQWDFYQDSLIFSPMSMGKIKWKASPSKIEFEISTHFWDSLGKPIDTTDQITIDYKLNKTKDSLFGTLTNLYGKHQFSMIKAKNYAEFLNKRYQIDFSLPKDDSVKTIGYFGEQRSPDKVYGLKVFMGYSKGELITKTALSDNLNQFSSDIKSFKDSIKDNGSRTINHKAFLDRRFHLRVYADKKIPDDTIADILKTEIKVDSSSISNRAIEIFGASSKQDTIPLRIYRIYQSEEHQTRGKLINTKSYTIYN